MVENWAESAITAIPQINESGMRITGLCRASAASKQQTELMAMAIIVTRARCATRTEAIWSCSLSLAAPAQMQPTAPMAIANAAIASNIERDQFAETEKITAIHPHMEYSSHMCPRYPRLASRSGRL